MSVTTCARDQFTVSYTTGDGIDGAVLNVKRVHVTPDERLARRHVYLGLAPHSGHSFLAPADHDGRVFDSAGAAQLFALQRGYTELYRRRVWCPIHRCLHSFMDRPAPYLPTVGCVHDHPNVTREDYDPQRAHARSRRERESWQKGSSRDRHRREHLLDTI